MYLTKPFNPMELLTTARRIFEERDRQDSRDGGGVRYRL